MKLILKASRFGSVRVMTEGDAEFFTISHPPNPGQHARVRSHLPGLASFDGRDTEDAVERCVELLGMWMRRHLGGRVPIEVVDQRDGSRAS